MFNIAGQDQSFVSAWTSLDPYAQLVKSLLPRAAAVRVFDANAELRWSSEATTGPDLPRLIAESAQRAQNDRGAAGLLHAWMTPDQVRQRLIECRRVLCPPDLN